MATNSAPETQQQSVVHEDPHPTPITSYIGLFIGFLLLVLMVFLQAQADPLM